MLIVSKLEQNSYAEATAIALVLLAMSFATLAVINLLERRSRRDMSNVATIASSHAISVAGRESALVRRLLIGAALVVVGIFIVVPVVLVFFLALENGFAAYWHGLSAIQRRCIRSS